MSLLPTTGYKTPSLVVLVWIILMPVKDFVCVHCLIREEHNNKASFTEQPFMKALTTLLARLNCSVSRPAEWRIIKFISCGTHYSCFWEYQLTRDSENEQEDYYSQYHCYLWYANVLSPCGCSLAMDNLCCSPTIINGKKSRQNTNKPWTPEVRIII